MRALAPVVRLNWCEPNVLNSTPILVVLTLNFSLGNTKISPTRQIEGTEKYYQTGSHNIQSSWLQEKNIMEPMGLESSKDLSNFQKKWKWAWAVKGFQPILREN